MRWPWAYGRSYDTWRCTDFTASLRFRLIPAWWKWHGLETTYVVEWLFFEWVFERIN
jgi:hypothetical protein